MKCSNCGTELTDVNAPCPVCGTVTEAKDDMDTIIANILEEDYKPKFEEAEPEKPLGNQPVTAKQSTPMKTPGAVKKARNQRNGKNGSARNGSKPTRNGKTTVRNGKTTNGTTERKGNTKLSEQIVEGLRYALAGVILLFTMSLFFTWFTLSGNAVNHGYVRTEAGASYLYKGIENNSIESLESYDGPIATFSAMDLYGFGRNVAEDYGTVIGPSGAEAMSIVGVVQKYYMQSVILILLINILCLALVLLFRSLRPMAVVRNLSFVNFVIIGLNYMALKLPWFSIFAVKTKDMLKQMDGHHQISTAMDGILFDDRVYRYEMYHERGFIFAMSMLILWLFLSIILAEVKSRRDEIAIEKGEIE